MDKDLYTVGHAAERLSIGRTKLYQLLADGSIESVLLGSARRIPADALDQFVASLRTKAVAK